MSAACNAPRAAEAGSNTPWASRGRRRGERRKRRWAIPPSMYIGSIRAARHLPVPPWPGVPQTRPHRRSHLRITAKAPVRVVTLAPAPFFVFLASSLSASRHQRVYGPRSLYEPLSLVSCNVRTGTVPRSPVIHPIALTSGPRVDHPTPAPNADVPRPLTPPPPLPPPRY